MTALTASTITVKVAGRQYAVPAEARIGLSAPIARAYRVLLLGEHDGDFLVLTDTYAPEVTREFVEALTTQPPTIITVSSTELDAAISTVFGEDDKPRRPPTSLAEILVESDTLTAEQVAEGAMYAATTGTSLGPAIIELGFINPWTLAQLISRYLALPVLNLRTRNTMEIPTDLLPQAFLRTHRLVPITLTAETVTIAMVDPLDRALVDQIAQETGRQIHAVLTTDRDIDWALRQIYRADNVRTSTQDLVLRQPRNSAHVTFERRQIVGFVLLGLIVVFGLLLNWRWTLIVVNATLTAIYVSFAFYKGYLLLRGLTVDLAISTPRDDLRALRDDDLPSITILIPLYREAAIVPVLLRAIARPRLSRH